MKLLGEVQIMLDIRLSRGRDNIKNYGGEKFLKIFGFSCFQASEDMICSRVPSMGWGGGERNKGGRVKGIRGEGGGGGG